VGIESRDYNRDSDYTGALAGWGLDYISPVVKWLIVANVVVFLGQIFLTRPMTVDDWKAQLEFYPQEYRDEILESIEKPPKRDTDNKEKKSATDSAEDESLPDAFPAEAFLSSQRVSIVQEWLELDSRKVLRGQVWRVVTYAFCHDRLGVWHILFNMLFLYWFGVTLESMYGPREFLLFYLVAAAISGLATVGLNVWTSSYAATVGASGAIMAVLMVYAIHYPRNTIRVFWFFPVEVRWVVLFYIIWDLHPLLLALAGDRLYTSVAHAAHLGGLAFGYVYWKFNLNLERWVDRLPKPRGRRVVHDGDERRNWQRPSERTLDQQVDDVLRKISESGEASLTDRERRLLASASERYKARRR
jgi:membrane associated rhomboid family serine protease